MIGNEDAFDEWILKGHLESLGCHPKGPNCHCPWHEDKTPSAWVKADQDGHWRVMCQSIACGRKGDIYDLRNEKPTMDKGKDVKVARIAREPPPKTILANKEAVIAMAKSAGTVEAWYSYGPKDARCLIIARIVKRGGDKMFWSFTPLEDGAYVLGKDLRSNHPIYRADELKDVPLVLVCEGEKSVNAAVRFGIQATTSNGGAKHAKGSDWSALRGKTVVLWPDNDEAGKLYMDDVEAILTGLDCTISRIDVSKMELPPKGDIADLVAKWPEPTQKHTDILTALMDDAEPCGPVAELRAYHKQVKDGLWKSLDSPLADVGRLSRAFVPGSITILCADPGAGKSFFLLQLMAFWYYQGVVSFARLLEDERVLHVSRTLAQLSGREGHTRSEWIEANAEQTERDTADHAKTLNAIGARMLAEGTVDGKSKDICTAETICEWAEAKAAAGARVVIIDPITAVGASDKPWIQDFATVMSLKATARKYKCSIFVTTHPRTGTKAPSMHAISGGSAWSKYSHTILWLERHGEPKPVQTKGGQIMANRTMHILKSRNGPGAGAQVAMKWGTDLQLHELGIITVNPPACAVAKEVAEMDKTRRINAKKLSDKPQESEDLFK